MKKFMSDNTSQDFSSRRHFHWTKKVSNEEDDEEDLPPPPKPSPNPSHDENNQKKDSSAAAQPLPPTPLRPPRKKLSAVAVLKLRSALHALARNRSHSPHGLGGRVVGTLFGSRRGHVHFAFQKDPTSPPAFLVELATPISGLVREMASGLVRIALECDKLTDSEAKDAGDEKTPPAAPDRRRRPPLLLEENRWRTYCNGRKYGFAARRECGEKEWKILRAVEPISMGAGVLPAPAKTAEDGGSDGGEGDEEIMYMRAKFERVVGSRDSEAFYMMNPDSNGAPELSIYLLRV